GWCFGLTCAGAEPNQPPWPGDCDDADDAVNPGADEECNGRDDDCDGLVDQHAEDRDRDGFLTDCVENEDEVDCDDDLATVNIDADELCDGLDNDCDEDVDEGLAVDDDGDGWPRFGSCRVGGAEWDCDD